MQLNTIVENNSSEIECPEIGSDELAPLCKLEAYFNLLVNKIPVISAIVLIVIALLITADVCGRLFFNKAIDGITDLEGLSMAFIGFGGMAMAITHRQSMQIDLFYVTFKSKVQRNINLLGMTLCFFISSLITWRSTVSALAWTRKSAILEIPEWAFMLVTAFCFLVTTIACLFQILHALKSMIQRKEYVNILIAFVIVCFIIALPFIYREIGIKIHNLALGGIGFLVLMILILLRIPLGLMMGFVGMLGLFAISRRPEAALVNLGPIPFMNTANFLFITFPMFMLMGDLTFRSGVSDDLFFTAKKWLGRMPGGLALASVGGCAGFGAVCGDSMATCVTMSSVALPPMRENNYDLGLATGCLAAGGTLGILIPPSMGFIVYSMMTEESIGKLFVAGIFPGILLAIIFMGIIILRVKLNPKLAPSLPSATWAEKIKSLPKLLPIIVLFTVVVGGILYGKFTPGEGGAVGSIMVLVYALVRRKMGLKELQTTLYTSAALFGKMFILFIGLYVFGAFLAASRLPNLLSEFIVGMEVNRYIILAAIIFVYIILGCVMNIIPMMMLTLPSIFPTVQALGFDGIWFGVITVIVMEMGMITPPVGINVFTLASLVPDIPMSTIFKGVLPFFGGMLLCILIIVLFPSIALFLPSMM